MGGWVDATSVFADVPEESRRRCAFPSHLHHLEIGAVAEILKCVEHFYFDRKNFSIFKTTLNFQLYGEITASSR